ncbi:AMP-binding protein [Actinomadura sp. ATCC 31491]|uniref:AMP-binding protein n=1 Tax=Actinomadura luzonensis TaxID=2805427 RepID=A0ABT0G2A0_9ACTN|nr:AMP-binding protein [Actinomadura luzonensis]MCK2218639.1 AMP-binding protein [Actinomadura luzonensis]
MNALTPADVRTLGEMFVRAAELHPGQVAGTFSPGGRLTARDLLRDGREAAARLRSCGAGPGTPVAVLLQSPLDFLRVTAGVALAGAVLVPLAVSAGFTKAFLSRMRHVLADSGARVAVIDDLYAEPFAELAPGLRIVPLSRLAGPYARLLGEPEPYELPETGADDLALIQYTSGSTSAPRGVALTHRNVLAGLRVLQRGVDARPGDVTCHWLPLSHDMGLFSTLAAVGAGVAVHVSAPQDFVKRPEEWLRWFCDLRASIYVGPAFGYRYLLDSVPPEEAAGYDLSAVRVMLNGAEPIDPDLIGAFQDRFGPAGLDPRAMTPCYGLAEATLAATFTPAGERARVDWVDRDLLSGSGLAMPLRSGDPGARGVVSCGVPAPGVEVRVVRDGAEAEERTVGDVEVRGEPVMRGYLGRAPIPDGGWCPTGDLGYLAGGALHVTGRRKEMIILNGRNHYPEDVEALARRVPGVYRGRAVAVVLPADPVRGRPERIAVLAEAALARPPYGRLVGDLRAAAAEELGGGCVDVVLLGRGGLLRTTSGKFQRLLMRDHLLAGSLERVLDHVTADERVESAA